MKWKAELIQISEDPVPTDAFLRLYKRCVLLALKEKGELTEMQFRRAEELLKA